MSVLQNEIINCRFFLFVKSLVIRVVIRVSERKKLIVLIIRVEYANRVALLFTGCKVAFYGCMGILRKHVHSYYTCILWTFYGSNVVGPSPTATRKLLPCRPIISWKKNG